MDFYKFVASINEDGKRAERLIAEDLMDSLESKFEGREPLSWKELFNLTASFEDMTDEAFKTKDLLGDAKTYALLEAHAKNKA